MPYCPDCGTEKVNDSCSKCSAASEPSDALPAVSLQSQPVPEMQAIHSGATPRRLLNSFQKNVLFVAVTILVLAAIGYFANHIVQERARQLAEQKVQWRKENIKVLKDLSGIGALSNEEQIRVDNAGDDFDKLQQVLLDIHQERINFWSGRLEELSTKYREYKNSYYSQAYYSGEYLGPKFDKALQDAQVNYLGYTKSKEEIRAWKPVPFEAYQAGKVIDPRSTTKQKTSEQ